MTAEQLSIFLENKAGRLAEVTRTLSEAGINIRALSLADTSDFGILRIIVSDHERAKAVLKERGFTLGRTTVVAVEVEDKPGGLHSILELLSANGINVQRRPISDASFAARLQYAPLSSTNTCPLVGTSVATAASMLNVPLP